MHWHPPRTLHKGPRFTVHDLKLIEVQESVCSEFPSPFLRHHNDINHPVGLTTVQVYLCPEAAGA